MSAGVRGRMHAPTMLVGAVFLLIALLMLAAGLVLALQDSREARDVDAHGRLTAGRILDKSIHVDRTSGGGASFRLAYRFVSDQGEEIAATASVGSAVWDRLQPGDSIEIRYLAEAPSIHRVEGEQAEWLLPVMLIVLGAVLTLPGGVLAWLAVRRPRPGPVMRRRSGSFSRWPVLLFGALLLVVGVPLVLGGAYQVVALGARAAAFEADGQRVEGMVLTKAIDTRRNRSTSSGTRSTSRRHRATYRYRTIEGQQVVGTADLDPEAWNRLQERGPIGVVYLPKTPWRHRLEGEAGGRVGFLIMALFGLVSTAIGAGALVVGLRQPGASMPRVFLGTRAAGATEAAAEQSPPASEPMTPQRRGWLVPIVGGGFLVAGLALLVNGIDRSIEERQFAATGQLAEGHIVAKSIERAGAGDRERTRYLATYRFLTADGVSFDGAYELAVEAWEALEDGEPVSVRYLPGEPQKNRHASESGIGEMVVAFLLGPVCAGVGGALLYSLFRRKA